MNTVVLDAMRERDIDALIIGREANARAIAGATRLWLAGTRAFAPGCVVVREPAGEYVLANSADAVPAGFPVEHLYGITWNPEKMAAAIGAIPGLAAARRVAVDGMTPMMFDLLRALIPRVEFVDAAPVLVALWSSPDPERDAGVRAAAEVAAAGLAAMAAALKPGVRPRTLRGVCAATFATFGVTTPAFEAVAAPLDAAAATWLPPERILGEGERVVLRAGALRDGWEASVARTLLVGAHGATEQPGPASWSALFDACRAGVTAGSLRSRGAVLYGVGRGVEPWDDDFVLAPGVMCALETSDATSVRQGVAHITDDAPELVI